MYVRCPLEPAQKLYNIYPFPWCKVLKQSWLNRLTFCMQFNFVCFYHMAVCFKLNFVKTKSDVLSGLIRDQTVCIGYQQTTKVAVNRETVKRISTG